MGKNVSEDGGRSLRTEFSSSGDAWFLIGYDDTEWMLRSSIFLKSYRILTNNIAKGRQSV